MGIQPGWVFHMVKQSQIIPTLKKSNLSKSIFRDSMRFLCQMVTGMIQKSCFKWASDGFCLLHPFNHAPAELGLFILHFDLCRSRKSEGAMCWLLPWIWSKSQPLSLLGPVRALQLRSKHVYTICFSSFIYWHLWHGHVWEHHSTWDLQKHNGWCFRGSSPDQFLACANPIANFPKMTRPHNLRIVVEPPAPFLGF